MKNDFASFNGIVNFSQLHFTIDEAKKNWLRDDNIVKLSYMNMALRGQIEYEEAREKCESLGGLIKKLREQIVVSGMDKNVKDVLDRRLSQIGNVLERFRFYGSEGLEQYLMELIGQIVIISDEIADKGGKDIAKKMGAVMSAGLSIIRETASYAGKIRTAVEEGKKTYCVC